MNKNNWLERSIHPALPKITNEIFLFALVILFAIVTRFYDLEARVMSHDESLHTYFSWLLYQGRGYQHSPMMHGPYQFHNISLIYYLFGANDFTARIPAVLFSIATVWMVWVWRRYLGKAGAIIGGLLMVISPYMLYYGRYVRNESFVAFSGIVLLYGILRYIETSNQRYLYMLALAQVLHFTAKETAYIYTMQALIFLTFYFIARVTRRTWEGNEYLYRGFIIALSLGILLAGLTFGIRLSSHNTGTLSATEVVQPADPDESASPSQTEAGTPLAEIFLALGAVLAFSAAGYFLIRGYTWARLLTEPSFDLLMLLGTLVIPLGTAVVINVAKKWLPVNIPTTMEEVNALAPNDLLIVGSFIAGMFALSIAIGLLWRRDWWKYALTFWVPFIILYTTIFTNSDGFFTGVVGSLGYWIVQQSVERGSQPWYFYTLVQIPMYEFLPALGVWLGVIIAIMRKPAPIVDESTNELIVHESEEQNYLNTFSLLLWWSISSILAFTIAGEKMPWLTVHMTLPMILLSGWALGYVVDTTDWEALRQNKIWLTLGITFIFLSSLFSALFFASGANPPFQGKELAQLQATNAFLLPALAAIVSAGVLIYLFSKWTFSQVMRIFTLVFFAGLGVLTMRASFRASYVTYDQATEYLVYAHGASGIKEIISQANEISERTTGDPYNIALAYDASAPDTGVSWPFVWYLRDFSNQTSFDKPTRSLRDRVLIIVDQKNFDKIDAALGPNYYRFDYIRMWWPNQDYFGLTSERNEEIPFDENYSCKGALGFYKWFKSTDYSRICNALTNPQIRAGIFNIWLNRDYKLYAEATNHSDMTLTTWQPSDQMRMYIRKDIAAQIWNYGVAPVALEEVVDPTEGKTVDLSADIMLDASNPTAAVALNAPRSLAFAQDGTFYVADSRNHRIKHLDINGNLLQEWGGFADGIAEPAGWGKFNEPWGIALDSDGNVYVTDTWNHRIQKFNNEGRFLLTWGKNGLGENPDELYGPRGIAVDAQGHVFVADTGNKRIVVYDSQGNFITEFGSAGFDPGLFDEPVGVAVDAQGIVYVADTWNQRVQTFQPSSDGTFYTPLKQWDVYGWFGQSLENKPFIAVNAQGNVFITDPENYRVMEFNNAGEIVRLWGDYGSSSNTFGQTSGIAVDNDGHVWVTDPVFNRILRFTLP